MRDLETIRLALSGAETGTGIRHAATSSAAKTIDRIVDVFPAAEGHVRAMISTSLRAIISRALLKTKDGSGHVAATDHDRHARYQQSDPRGQDRTDVLDSRPVSNSACRRWTKTCRTWSKGVTNAEAQQSSCRTTLAASRRSCVEGGLRRKRRQTQAK